MTFLLHSIFIREQRELNRVLLWIALPTYTQILFVYIYVMTRQIEMTSLLYSMLREKQKELNGVSL